MMESSRARTQPRLFNLRFPPLAFPAVEHDEVKRLVRVRLYLGVEPEALDVGLDLVADLIADLLRLRLLRLFCNAGTPAGAFAPGSISFRASSQWGV